MTFKRRLFISNVLMLIIPALLSFMVTGFIMLALTNTNDNHRDSVGGNEELFNNSVKKVNTLADKWSQSIDLENMKNDIKKFNSENESSKVSLAIYRDKELMFPDSQLAGGGVYELALTQDDGHVFVMDNTAVFNRDVNGYRIVLTDANFKLFTRKPYKDYNNSFFDLGAMVFLFATVITLLTNWFLTRFIFKSIIVPLDTLVYGVHQIRDGNLNYSIEYTGKDEFAGVCSDFNEMAKRLLDSVNERQKNEANRKELIAGISHDLRTPLTSIKAYVEGIEKGVASTREAQKRYLEIIRNKADDLEYIVSQLFLFSKLDVGEFPFYLEQVDIGRELGGMISAVAEEYVRKGLNVILVQNVKNIYVKVDIVQLRNAVTNVLENSVKYKNREQGKMRIICKADGEYVTIALTDNGPGVTSEALEKMFDVFYRGDISRSNPSKGSGLGLAITAKILERLGGSIRAENVPEGGLAIIMKLPIYKGDDSVEKNSDY